MTDEADLSPEREAAVRRLLAAAGSEPAPELPQELAERLDATLGDLVAERGIPSVPSVPSPEEPLAPVVPLSRRRRRTFAALFVAAAAVVVAGIGVPLLHDTPQKDPAASSETALSRTPDAGTAAAPSGDTGHGTAGIMSDRASAGKRPRADTYNAVSGPSRRVGKQYVRNDLIRLRHQVPADATYTSRKVHAPSGFTCARGRFGRGYLLGVRYAGAPAVVAFRAPAGSTQVAEVLQCGTAVVLRSITLPTP